MSDFPPCRMCFVGQHRKCEGDFTAHCGCRACYESEGGPFWHPPDGAPWDVPIGEEQSDGE